MRKPLIVASVVVLCVGFFTVEAQAAGSSTGIAFLDPEYSPTACSATGWYCDDGTDAFQGKVDSAKDSCMNARKVTVFRKRAGPDARIGSFTSVVDGYWGVSIEDPGDGTYYAQVTPRVRRGRTICRGARSPDLLVDEF